MRLRATLLRPSGGLRPLASIIKGMFTNGEQGVWYDPSDLSTLYQDAAGTIPVTAVEQPVGLMLDKSKGLVLGPELVQNGDFSQGTTGWTVINADATHIVTFADGGIRYQSDTTTPSLQVLAAAGTLPAGKTYLVEAVCSKWTSGSVKLFETLTGTLIVNGVGKFTARITPAAGTQVIVLRNSANVDLTLDSISVRELPGWHASQATATSRPVLKQDANGCYYLRFDGTDDFLVTPSINFTSTDKMMVCAGVRKLSNAAAGILVELGNASPGAFWLGAPGNAAKEDIFNFSDVGGSRNVRLSTAAPITGVYSSRADLGAKTIDGRINTNPMVAFGSFGSGGTYGNYPLYIGRRAGTSLPFNGHLYGLIIRGAATSDSQIKSVEKYINGKTRAF